MFNKYFKTQKLFKLSITSDLIHKLENQLFFFFIMST